MLVEIDLETIDTHGLEKQSKWQMDLLSPFGNSLLGLNLLSPSPVRRARFLRPLMILLPPSGDGVDGVPCIRNPSHIIWPSIRRWLSDAAQAGWRIAALPS